MTPAAGTIFTATLAALPGFPQLRGRRLRLRGPRADDADALLALFSDPAVMRYWSRPPMTARGEAQGLIAEILDAFAQRTMLNWMVVGVDDVPVGTCTLFHFDPRLRHAEIGYSLRSDHWGKGLALEAVTLALHWGFRTLCLQRIEASTDPRNAASRALLQRLGFVSEGVLRERHDVGDPVTDSELFGLPAKDWGAHQPRSITPRAP